MSASFLFIVLCAALLAVAGCAEQASVPPGQETSLQTDSQTVDQAADNAFLGDKSIEIGEMI